MRLAAGTGAVRHPSSGRAPNRRGPQAPQEAAPQGSGKARSGLEATGHSASGTDGEPRKALSSPRAQAPTRVTLKLSSPRAGAPLPLPAAWCWWTPGGQKPEGGRQSLEHRHSAPNVSSWAAASGLLPSAMGTAKEWGDPVWSRPPASSAEPGSPPHLGHGQGEPTRRGVRSWKEGKPASSPRRGKRRGARRGLPRGPCWKPQEIARLWQRRWGSQETPPACHSQDMTALRSA